jgi:uncharacterized membrane protein HdeD (DUF308 family)
MFWKRLALFFTPSPGPLTLTWAAGFVFCAAGLLYGTYGLSTAKLTDSLLLMSLSGAPLTGVLLLIGALREHRHGPRFLLWGMLALLVSASLGGFAFSMAQSVPEARSGLPVILLCCSPIALLPLGVTIATGIKAFPELRAILRAARYQRILTMVDVRGETSLAEIAQEIALEPEPTLSLLEELIASGELMAFISRPDERVYSLAALAEKQRLLLAVVDARGKARLDDLVNELHAPRSLVRTWVYHLVQRGQFHGALDWEQGWLYSRQAAQLDQADGRCPHCGGVLDLAGKGVIQCAHCGVEVFL